MSTEPDMMGVAKSRHLSPTQIRRCGPTPEDRWPVCRYAVKYRGGPLKGQPVLDKAGEAICFCLCKDGNQKHRQRHEDVAHDGTCFWCGEAL